jgi:hypothetical protein
MDLLSGGELEVDAGASEEVECEFSLWLFSSKDRGKVKS